ncbi:hypothetical protein ACIOEZ_22725 [Streptomyces sp. NPDC087866]|uniref:hypothetical protein n=1 Tax=unclassified Streptomyces TaxID=2593676 RepID=UPI0022569789|nr:hypothetical protein [Streptomyces sp. NBC_01789]MCX4450037.1 hypothetical protein [Streptomyces sp. NBC_01789]
MCATPDTGGQECAGCSWRMWDDPVLGALADDDREAARTALCTAQHTWDLRAATLSQGDEEGLRRIAPLLRAGPADPAKPVPHPEDSLPPHDSARWQQILTDLVDGRIPDVVFAEFTPDRVRVIRAAADSSGIPRQADAGSADWGSLVPVLEGDAEPRRFRLAGGIGTQEPLERAEFDAAVTRWLRTHPALCRARTLVILGRRSGWVLLDRAAALLRSLHRPSAEIGPGPGEAAGIPGTDTEDAVRAALRTAPLAVDHSLLLARVDRRTGEVHAHTQVLFPAGSRLRRGETATAEITVYGGLAARAPVLLPVLAGAPGADGSGAVTLSARRTALAAFAPARLAFVLHGPGEVTPDEGAAPGTARPEGHARGELPDIPALLGSLPRRVIHPPALEVFLTVEMSGTGPAETGERLTFVRDVIAALDRRHGPGLRVGVVGHYDHAVHENRYGPRPVLLRRVPAGPARTALAELTGWRPARRAQDTASSLEDALKEVGRLVKGRARPARPPHTERVLLVVGRRPPGLPEQHEVVPSCPLGADWRAELDALHARGVRVMARADRETGPGKPGPVQHYALSAWDALGAGGSFRPGADTADDVADALAPPWQWDGLPCPLALATPLL